jgi:hypothetical protein
MTTDVRAPSVASWTGLVLGAFALAVTAVEIAAGPFDPEPELEDVVVEKAESLYDSLRGYFRDEQSTEPVSERVDPPSFDRRIGATTAAAGAFAVGLALAGFARRENPRVAGGAAVLGVAALPFGLALSVLGAAIVVAIAARILPQARL